MNYLAVSRDFAPDSLPRYLSKNNANISRLASLGSLFQGALSVVPLRHPLDQARSMLRQHRKALASQSENRFVRRYVEDIGHFEFGLAHKALLFPEMGEMIERFSRDSIDYWLGYWLAAFRHLKPHKSILFVDMEEFTERCAIEDLLDALGLPQDPTVVANAQSLVRPMPPAKCEDEPNPRLLDEAMAVFEMLRSSAEI